MMNCHSPADFMRRGGLVVSGGAAGERITKFFSFRTEV